MKVRISRWIFFREHRNDAPCDPWDYEPDPRAALVVAQCRRLKMLKDLESIDAEIERLEAKL